MTASCSLSRITCKTPRTVPKFFESRTWRFVLRTAVQRFALEVGDNLPLKRFVDELVTYWQNKLSREEFITLFIPPNLTWRRAYEQMQKTGQLAHDPEGERLLDYVARRMKYEMLLEYSLTSRRGRTLEKNRLFRCYHRT